MVVTSPRLRFLITTMGRMREHPIHHLWFQVIIDECLTVQNKDALQTKEAWRQSMVARHGVYMMSATFFRSRFDKLYYMLKILRTQLPETKEYLDTILANTIVCNIPVKGREWKEDIHGYKLTSSLQEKYDKVRNNSTKLRSAEKIYIELTSFISEHVDYIKLFEKTLTALPVGRRCLVYSKSRTEAEKIAKRIKSITRYPDKSGKHVVISYTEGTYGLNDLTGYNTIVTRPPEPDKLPQMKGRINRPGQKEDILYLEYIIIKNTIEEASHLRLQLANQFHNSHILPLAEFYQLAIGNS